jgi:CHASE2 domain-containing sensor protein
MYLGIGLYIFPEGGGHDTPYIKLRPLIFFIFPSLLLGCLVAWVVGSPKRNLFLTFPLCLGGIIVGAVLIAIAFWPWDYLVATIKGLF